MQFYYVAFGNETQMFVIATFKEDRNGALALRDCINGGIRENTPTKFVTCHVLSFED